MLASLFSFLSTKQRLRQYIAFFVPSLKRRSDLHVNDFLLGFYESKNIVPNFHLQMLLVSS